MTAAPLVMMVAIFYFVQSLFAWRRKITPYVFWYGVIVIVLVLFTDSVIHAAYLDENSPYYPADEEVPIEGVIQKQWRGWIYQQDKNGDQRIRRVRYELCVLQTLSTYPKIEMT